VHHTCNKKRQIKTPKLAYGQLWCIWCIMNMQLQKEVISMHNQQAVKKMCDPKMPGWKRMWDQRWWPRNGCDNSSMAKILITTIQVNLVPSPSETWKRTHKFTWVVVGKIFANELLSQPFLGHHLWFHIFFHPGILGLHTSFFTACWFWIGIAQLIRCVTL